MIVKEHLASYQRLAPYMMPAMLMLGNQANTSGQPLRCQYQTLDLDGGDYQLDLGEPASERNNLRSLKHCWNTVFNLGTIEHVWDAHQAWVNAASMVKPGGHFLTCSPVAGWEGHGIHITEAGMILRFFARNRFDLRDYWYTTQAGNECEAPKRNGGKSVLLWMAAQMVDAPGPLENWHKPSQVYVDGKKPQ